MFLEACWPPALWDTKQKLKHPPLKTDLTAEVQNLEMLGHQTVEEKNDFQTRLQTWIYNTAVTQAFLGMCFPGTLK